MPSSQKLLMRRLSSWLLLPALALATACGKTGDRRASGGLDALIGVETK